MTFGGKNYLRTAGGGVGAKVSRGQWLSATKDRQRITIVDAMANIRNPPMVSFDASFTWEQLAILWLRKHFWPFLLPSGTSILVLCVDRPATTLSDDQRAVGEGPRSYVARKRAKANRSVFASLSLDRMAGRESRGPFDAPLHDGRFDTVYTDVPASGDEGGVTLYTLMENRQWLYEIYLPMLGLALTNLFQQPLQRLNSVISPEEKPYIRGSAVWELVLYGFRLDKELLEPVSVTVKPFAVAEGLVRVNYLKSKLSAVLEADLTMIAWARVLASEHRNTPIALASIDGDLWLNSALFINYLRVNNIFEPTLYLFQLPTKIDKGSSWSDEVVGREYADMERAAEAWHDLRGKSETSAIRSGASFSQIINFFAVLAFWEHDYIPKVPGIGQTVIEVYHGGLGTSGFGAPDYGPLVRPGLHEPGVPVTFSVDPHVVHELINSRVGKNAARRPFICAMYVAKALEFVLNYATNDPFEVQTDMTAVDELTGEPFYGFVRAPVTDDDYVDDKKITCVKKIVIPAGVPRSPGQIVIKSLAEFLPSVTVQ